jgi:two-component system cell cycle sensor histidine kinase/response regulator CckA
MGKPLRVLMVEDSENDALLTIRALKNGGYDPEYARVETAEAMRKALQEKPWDVILCDYQMPKFNGFAAIAQLKETGIDIPLIIVSGAIGEETAVECMRSGARDYITKGNQSRLAPAVERELNEVESRRHRKRADEALVQKNKRLDLAQSAAKAGIWDWDIITGHIEWSPQMFGLLGLDPQSTTASFEAWRTALHPEDVEIAGQRIDEALKEGTHLNSDYRVILPDGRIRWINAGGDGEYDGQGRPVRMIGICIDITERKQSEEALKKTERLKSGLLDNMNETQHIAMIGSWEWDLKTNHVWWSDETYRIFGVTPQDFVPNFEANCKFIHPDDLARYGKSFEHSIKTREPLAYDCRLVTNDGHLKHCHAGGMCHYDDSGQPIRFIGTIMDITERKQAEEELKTNKAKLSNALEMAHLGHWEYDAANDLFTFNDQFYNIFRTTVEQVGGYTMHSAEYAHRFIHPDDIHLVGEETRKAIETTDPHFKRQIEHRILYADGTVGYITVRFFIVKDSHGRTVKTYGVNQDITERKREEKEKEKLQDQLLQSQKMESVGRLAGGVAHDFNNMLGVILGHAEMAMEKVDPTEPLYGNLEEIRKSANRSTDLTRQLLAFARKQMVSPKVMDLNETIEGMLKMLRRLIGEDINLAWLPGAYLWPVKMDESQIDQVLANLIVNSRDAITGVGKVTLETQNVYCDEAYCADHAGCVPGDYVLLTVSDDGCGMDKEIQSKLFEPFFTTKEMGKGTGLGLATVYGIVKQNSGFIDVYSEPDEGTTLKIYLPRYIGKIEKARMEGPQKPVMLGNETILVVEDEPALLELSCSMLEKQGYRVLAAHTPGEAIRLAEEYTEEIHLLITDVVMPEMNGQELAKKMLCLYPNMRRLFMSGYTADIIAHHGVLDEGMHFLQKPFSRKALTTKVGEALEGAA